MNFPFDYQYQNCWCYLSIVVYLWGNANPSWIRDRRTNHVTNSNCQLLAVAWSVFIKRETRILQINWLTLKVPLRPPSGTGDGTRSKKTACLLLNYNHLHS